MTIAAKHLDPLVGLDTHIILIPTPAGPVPTPLPHPYIGMLLDPMDYVPIIGATTLINGLPRGQAGSSGMAMPPHIPMGGPFLKPPSNESEIFMGSATVVVDGEPQSFLGLPVLSCQDIGMPAPPRAKKKTVAKSLMLPTTVVLSIPMGMLVLIGGPPTISMMAMGMKLGLAGLKKLAKLGPIKRAIEALSEKLHALAEKAMKKLGLGDGARNVVHKAICTVTGHPVDVATGKVFTDAVDVEFGGPIPFRWERTWFSTSRYVGPLGHGFHHSYDMALIPAEGVLLFRTGDGRHVGLPLLEPGQEHYDKREHLTLIREANGYAIRNRQGLWHRFRPSAGKAGELALVEMSTSTGYGMRFDYDGRGCLTAIRLSSGRLVEVTNDEYGRITALIAPHPTTPGQRYYVVRYAYDGQGNLATVVDAHGQQTAFAYRGHLLARETNRNGLSFYFEYDGPDETARCVRTYGDGGIYARTIRYDLEQRRTFVTNSLGHTTSYLHDGALVLEVQDARGYTRKIEYDDDRQMVADTDELGQTTRYAYDARGNVTETAAPNGSKLNVEYGPHGFPIAATDAAGGSWQWKRDEHGRVVERIDPLGRSVKFNYAGAWLEGLTDPAQGRSHIQYDGAGNVSRVTTQDAATTQYEYDTAGRLVAITDAEGRTQRRERDLLGRVVRVSDATTADRIMTYDAEGNLVRLVRDRYEVLYRYQGMGRISAREENGTSVRFEYDTEEQLVAITNQHGTVYRFELDENGNTVREFGFDGLTRRYERDPKNRVARVQRPLERWSAYEYDAASRVTGVSYSDGTKESYGYYPDGSLATAVNGAGTVALERDILGRIVKDVQGAHWVETKYDELGLRREMRSSLGARQKVQRNAVGDVVSVADEASGFEAKFTRDKTGLELERKLPGGIRAKWQRDALGRPIQHSIEDATKVLRATGYRWDATDRLELVIDSQRGSTEFGRDARGDVAWARFADGTVDWRMPDAVGNLFRSEHAHDRSYGPSGELLAAHTPRGTTTYRYDAEGNLVEKVEPTGRTWRYTWSDAGQLAVVHRPDGSAVEFAYDAVGRRIEKRHRGQATRWVWDGNNPLHEWVEGSLEPLAATPPELGGSTDALIARREAELASHLTRGPPERGATDAPITWLFEPESAVPLAKVVGKNSFAFVTDYLGTPVSMTDATGREVWNASHGVYGELRDHTGARHACPFRWPGQYEDAETGLHYNRFRYYDPESGQYLSRDPIGLAGGIRLHGYPLDPTRGTDVFGLIAGVDDPRAGVQSHLSQFEPGSSVFVPESTLTDTVPTHGQLGRPDGMYVTTREAADKIEAAAGGDRAKMKDMLGIPADQWNEPIHRVDIPADQQKRLRMPTGMEKAANDNFRWGGYTSGGVPEAVIDPVPEHAIKGKGRCVTS